MCRHEPECAGLLWWSAKLRYFYTVVPGKSQLRTRLLLAADLESVHCGADVSQEHVSRQYKFEVKRATVYEQSFGALIGSVCSSWVPHECLPAAEHIVSRASPTQLKRGVKVTFAGEEGQGQGVTREWFKLVTRELLNPSKSLRLMSMPCWF